MLNRFFSLALAILFAQAVCARSLSISGSDLLSSSLQATIAQQLREEGIEAAFLLQGSLLASGDLEAAAADAALLAVPAGEQPSTGLRSYPFAFQVVTVGVHPSNPLREISYEQLAAVFSEDGGIDNWSQLVTGSDWRDRKISRIAYRMPGQITLEIFNAQVVRGSFKADLRSVPASPTALGSAIFDDVSMIALFPSLSDSTDLRMLAVKENADEQGYTPSADNVFYGDYTLRLPFVLVLSDAVAAEDAAAIIRALYSEPVTRALASEGYMPVSASERQAALQRLRS